MVNVTFYAFSVEGWLDYTSCLPSPSASFSWLCWLDCPCKYPSGWTLEIIDCFCELYCRSILYVMYAAHTTYNLCSMDTSIIVWYWTHQTHVFDLFPLFYVYSSEHSSYQSVIVFLWACPCSCNIETEYKFLFILCILERSRCWASLVNAKRKIGHFLMYLYGRINAKMHVYGCVFISRYQMIVMSVMIDAPFQSRTCVYVYRS